MKKPNKILQQEALKNLLSPQSIQNADSSLKEFYEYIQQGGEVDYMQNDQLLRTISTEAELTALIETMDQSANLELLKDAITKAKSRI